MLNIWETLVTIPKDFFFNQKKWFKTELVSFAVLWVHKVNLFCTYSVESIVLSELVECEQLRRPALMQLTAQED